jgi:hypothetical protein
VTRLPGIEGLTFAGTKFGTGNQDGGGTHLAAASTGSASTRTSLIDGTPVASCR